MNKLNTENIQLEMKNDKVSICLRKYGNDISKWPKDMRNDKTSALEIVGQFPGSLQFMSTEMQNDKEIVLTAINLHVGSLQ